ncbi:hypothetical protein D3C73_1258790 [compost metagenome]
MVSCDVVDGNQVAGEPFVRFTMPRVIDDDSCVPGGGLGQKALDGLTQRGPGAIHDIPDVIKPLLA